MNDITHKGPFTAHLPIVLGSGSPRRKELIANLGLDFEVVISTVEEPTPLPKETPIEYAVRMAHLKGKDVAGRRQEAVVIASDTVVAIDNEIMGKPSDDMDALRMLTTLSGKTHQVVSGVSLMAPGKAPCTFSVSTDVTMRSSTHEELLAYIATGEPTDKAGAYAIQGIGTFLVTEIKGSYTNVVGLPVARVLEALSSWGIVIPRKG